MNIGFVGLGGMGGALARRLMLSRKIHVFDLRREVTVEFSAAGAIAAGDLASLGRACEVIMFCLPDSDQVHEVLFGADGLAKALMPGAIVIDHTTGDPTQTRAIAAELEKSGAWATHSYVADLREEPIQWKSLPDAAFRQRALAVAATSKRIYAIGGLTPSGDSTQEVQIFDPASGTWSKGPDFPSTGSTKGFGASAWAIEASFRSR